MEARGQPTGRVAVIMPTYNERGNVESTAGRIRRAVPDADLLVVDDNSPDGTGEIADKLAAEDSHIHVLHRTGKAGLGAAYIAGFHWALGEGYGVLVEMDADGSHQPEELPALLAALAGADLVIGSRWVPGGTVRNWPKSRELLSRGGNTYARIMLGIKLKDATGGELVGDLPRAVGAVVVHHQQVGIRHRPTNPPGRRLDVAALVVGGHDHGDAPRGLPAGLHAAHDSCLPGASPPRGVRALPSLPLDVPAGYRVPGPP